MSIHRIELYGARVINRRLKEVITAKCQYRFQQIYHVVDSQTAHAVLQKETYGFNVFAATRVGEIQEGTDIADWYWISGEHNIADWLTRGKDPTYINQESVWQRVSDFLQIPEDEWPISKTYQVYNCHYQTQFSTLRLALC